MNIKNKIPNNMQYCIQFFNGLFIFTIPSFKANPYIKNGKNVRVLNSENSLLLIGRNPETTEIIRDMYIIFLLLSSLVGIICKMVRHVIKLSKYQAAALGVYKTDNVIDLPCSILAVITYNIWTIVYISI